MHFETFYIKKKYVLELTSESFTVGRATNCEYTLQAPDIKQKYLVQMSKRHFQITRDLSETDAPVYIEVKWKECQEFFDLFIR